MRSLMTLIVVAAVAVSASVHEPNEAVTEMCHGLGLEYAPKSQSRMLLSAKKRQAGHMTPLAPQAKGALASETPAAGSFDHVLASAFASPSHAEQAHLNAHKQQTAAKVSLAGAHTSAHITPEHLEAVKNAHHEIRKVLKDKIQGPVLKIGVCEYAPYSMTKNQDPDNAGGDEPAAFIQQDPAAAAAAATDAPAPVQWDGFSVQIWEELADKNGWQFEYVPGTYEENVQRLAAGELDTFATGMFLTANQRAKHPDWTWSSGFWLGGMGIMVKTGAPPSTADLIFTPSLWGNLGYLCLALIFAGHVYWLLEMDSEKTSMYDEDGKPVDNLVPRSWPHGPLLGTWWAAATCTTVGYGDYYPTGWASRFWALLGMLASLFVVGMWTGAITAALTAGALGGTPDNINSLADLVGKNVAVVSGSFPGNFMEALGTSTLIKANNMHDAVDALLTGKADAVVAVSDVIQFSATKGHGQGKTAMIGFPLHKHAMAFPLPPKSPGGDTLSAEKLTRALLELEDSDTMDQITRDFLG